MSKNLPTLVGETGGIINSADACERAVLDENGRFTVEALGPISRKTFCQFLGVADSTLTSWLQSETIPRYAAVALVLYGTLLDRERQLHNALEPFVAQIDGEYAVLGFERSQSETKKARVIARSLPSETYANAMAFASAAATRILLKSAANNLQTLYEQDEVMLAHVGDLIDQLSNANDILSQLDRSENYGAKNAEKF